MLESFRGMRDTLKQTEVLQRRRETQEAGWRSLEQPGFFRSNREISGQTEDYSYQSTTMDRRPQEKVSEERPRIPEAPQASGTSTAPTGAIWISACSSPAPCVTAPRMSLQGMLKDSQVLVTQQSLTLLSGCYPLVSGGALPLVTRGACPESPDSEAVDMLHPMRL
ncbi:hypothetical protein NDU88_002936 [Pleurodeles waltl]|uniref:Uncharacterized protein n=1 Tax=Pleurodeles waltl TaxID=8319 RepID=A0AAV7KTI1_PLEWA|nr:hypothetical protein NDU88_002936 [Pleurodeles waltl]